MAFRQARQILTETEVVPVVATSPEYFPYKLDQDASPMYYGLHRKDGAWMIIKETLSPGDDTYEVAVGASDIATNWTNRASLTYGIYEDAF